MRNRRLFLSMFLGILVGVAGCSRDGATPTEGGSLTDPDPSNPDGTDPPCTHPSLCEGGCTFTHGYWKNNPDDWWDDDLPIGDQELLLDLLNQPANVGDASVILAYQYIAAELNIAAGADGTEIEGALAAAEEWFFLYGVPSEVHSSTPEGHEALEIASQIAAFNGGEVGPGACAVASELAP